MRRFFETLHRHLPRSGLVVFDDHPEIEARAERADTLSQASFDPSLRVTTGYTLAQHDIWKGAPAGVRHEQGEHGAVEAHLAQARGLAGGGADGPRPVVEVLASVPGRFRITMPSHQNQASGPRAGVS